MRLYHFTCREHLPAILEAGLLKVTESNISDSREHKGPDVVWLTDDPDPDRHEGWAHAVKVDSAGRRTLISKTTARFTVEVPNHEVHHWPTWSRQQGIRNMWYRRLAVAGDPERWWVVTRPIPSDEWVEVGIDCQNVTSSVPSMPLRSSE